VSLDTEPNRASLDLFHFVLSDLQSRDQETAPGCKAELPAGRYQGRSGALTGSSPTRPHSISRGDKTIRQTVVYVSRTKGGPRS
jgi:hypothetical protein